ncbi:hypothetical protein K402DRAFT_391788 [Aulographum hederae CBS 113979]|uniref:Uncharacterized protein n=1 Tax=Aulographum hederae CBS 113979 TaxID=1176131 RepID=A0A6G1H667_9PEZI|nr:hypothetical protein K402DRAFT_391788 [Aulographum hederae CBS 113979]
MVEVGPWANNQHPSDPMLLPRTGESLWATLGLRGFEIFPPVLISRTPKFLCVHLQTGDERIDDMDHAARSQICLRLDEYILPIYLESTWGQGLGACCTRTHAFCHSTRTLLALLPPCIAQISVFGAEDWADVRLKGSHVTPIKLSQDLGSGEIVHFLWERYPVCSILQIGVGCGACSCCFSPPA